MFTYLVIKPVTYFFFFYNVNKQRQYKIRSGIIYIHKRNTDFKGIPSEDWFASDNKLQEQNVVPLLKTSQNQTGIS